VLPVKCEDFLSLVRDVDLAEFTADRPIGSLTWTPWSLVENNAVRWPREVPGKVLLAVPSCWDSVGSHGN
jgi:hypothetical protein